MKVEINMNECVTVRLSKAGAARLNALGREAVARGWSAENFTPRHEGEELTEQLWCLMGDFEGMFKMGATVPFEGNSFTYELKTSFALDEDDNCEATPLDCEGPSAGEGE